MKRSEFIHDIPIMSKNIKQMVSNIINGIKVSVFSLTSGEVGSGKHCYLPLGRGVFVNGAGNLETATKEFIENNAELLCRDSAFMVVSRINDRTFRIHSAQMVYIESDVEMVHLTKVAKLRGFSGAMDSNGNKVNASKIKSHANDN
jgi:hypothetical protein